MNSQLIAELTKMDEVEFRTLQHTLHIAEIVRDVMKTYNKDAHFMSERLEIPISDFHAVRNGAYILDLRIISKLQVLRAELETQAAADKANAKQVL